MDDYPDADEKHIVLEIKSVENKHTWQYIARLLKSQEDGRAVLRYLKNNKIEAIPTVLYLNGQKIGFRYYYTDVEYDGGPTRLHSRCIFDPKIKKYNEFLLDDIRRYGTSINTLEYQPYWNYKV